jgi:PhnB protein
MARLNPYLYFDGNCEQAFDFYRGVFGGEFLALLRYGDQPQDIPVDGGEADKVMHVSLPIGEAEKSGAVLMGSDFPRSGSQGFGNFDETLQVMLSVDTREEADRVYKSLSEGGDQKMQMQNTFWGAYFGTLRDRFGVHWMVSFEQREPGE